MSKNARDIFARDISKTPVTIFKKMPVTSKKWPWQILKIECHAHKKISRGKKLTLGEKGGGENFSDLVGVAKMGVAGKKNILGEIKSDEKGVAKKGVAKMGVAINF